MNLGSYSRFQMSLRDKQWTQRSLVERPDLPKHSNHYTRFRNKVNTFLRLFWNNDIIHKIELVHVVPPSTMIVDL